MTSKPPASEAKPHSESDLDLRIRVLLYLGQNGHQHLKKVQVDAQDGVVILQGILPSFYMRQLAIACAKRVAGVREIVDRLQAIGSLSPPAPTPDSFQPRGASRFATAAAW